MDKPGVKVPAKETASTPHLSCSPHKARAGRRRRPQPCEGTCHRKRLNHKQLDLDSCDTRCIDTVPHPTARRPVHTNCCSSAGTPQNTTSNDATECQGRAMVTSSSTALRNSHDLSLNLPQSELWKQKHWNLSARGSLKLPPRVARPKGGIAMM